VVVAGDFNTHTDVRLNVMMQMAGELSLTKVPIEVPYYGYTGPTGELEHLDHAFIRGGQVTRTWNYNYVRASDHQPFSFSVRIN
jgi:endonuclease/exonuclease/phosphatase (EEP) superfamily protein YafD